MSNIRANSFIQKVLYQLKKLNGRLVDLYLRGTVSQDVATGNVTYPETRWRIKRAILMPVENLNVFTAAQDFATAGRQFEFGGIYVTGTSIVIVELKDLPSNYESNLDDNFIIDHRRYVITKVQEFQEMQSMVFAIQELKGQLVNEIFEVKQTMSITDTVGSV